MIYSGLVSITFKKLSAREVVDLVLRAGLDGIEWSSDYHCPHGNRQQARLVRLLTEEAGLTVAAYGSYYRCGHTDPAEFEIVLDSAVELGAPLIRVWAGRQGSDIADESYRQGVIQDSRRIVALAAEAGVEVAYEFHRNSLTDTNQSALALLHAVEGVTTYWQPPQGADEAYNLAGIEVVSAWLRHLHLFSWRPTGSEGERRLPLVAKEAEWQAYLAAVAATKRDHFAMIEFVVNDEPENFLQDAAVLKAWLRAIDIGHLKV